MYKPVYVVFSGGIVAVFIKNRKHIHEHMIFYDRRPAQTL